MSSSRLRERFKSRRRVADERAVDVDLWSKSATPRRRRHSATHRFWPGRPFERGASIVEFAIILPLFVALGLGTIDTGFVMNDAIRLRQAVKESARLISGDDLFRDISTGMAATCSGATAPMTTPTWPPSPANSLTPRAQWALCRTVNILGGVGFDRAGVRVRMRMVTPEPDNPADPGGLTHFNIVTDAELGNESTGQALMMCVSAPTSARSGFLKSLYDDKVLNSRIILPMTSGDQVLGEPSAAGDPAPTSLNAQYGTGGDWTFCDPDVDGS